MIHIKTKQDIKKMQEGGKILAEAMEKVVNAIKPGITELNLENIATSEIEKHGGSPSFKKVEGYYNTLCISTNDVVVHGIPDKYVFKVGDVVGIDCGVFYKGFHTDMSESIILGEVDKEAREFLKVGKKALLEAIIEAKIGNRIGHISKKIQDIVEKQAGYSVVRTLVGHGVGRELHEEPEVPGFLNEDISKTPLLKEGMVIAIEVIYNKGKSDVKYDRDGWTIKTKDGQISGLYERTVAITKSGPVILTQ